MRGCVTVGTLYCLSGDCDSYVNMNVHILIKCHKMNGFALLKCIDLYVIIYIRRIVWERQSSGITKDLFCCLVSHITRSISLCSFIFLVRMDHVLYLLTVEKNPLMCWWRQWCGIFHYYWWTASIKPRLLCSSYRLRFLRAFPFLSWFQHLFLLC